MLALERRNRSSQGISASRGEFQIDVNAIFLLGVFGGRRSTLRHLSCTHLEGSASTGIEKPFAIRRRERLPEERLTLVALVVFTRSLRVRF